MNSIFIQEIKAADWKLVSRIVKLEKKNLGSEASINQWVIPVIIRYGKFIVAQKSRDGSDTNLLALHSPYLKDDSISQTRFFCL